MVQLMSVAILHKFCNDTVPSVILYQKKDITTKLDAKSLAYCLILFQHQKQ